MSTSHRDRFFATIAYQQVDRPACWLGLPVEQARPGLFAHFGVDSEHHLRLAINDDVYAVEVPYGHPPHNHIACAFDFARSRTNDRILTTPGFFEGKRDPSAVGSFAWPNPFEHMSREQCREAVLVAPRDRAIVGILWSAHFQDACAAFGLQDAFLAMLECPEMFDAVLDRIVDFYLKANELFYDATAGLVDAVLIGNDFGAQNGLMLAPELIRRHAFRGTRKLVAQARERGLTVIHHSCGSIRELIPDLIDIGVDVVHPIQALASGMAAEDLKQEYWSKVAFCGGVDAQHLLVSGTPGAIRTRVRELRELFPTGLVISPSHEAILPDVHPDSIEALFAEATAA